MITFTANRRRAVCASNDRLTTGSVGIPVEFSFDGWDGIVSKIAVFRAGDVSIDVALLEDACTVPPEVLTTPGETMTVGVYGTDGAGTVVIPTVYADAGRVVRGAEPSGIDPTPPTPSLVEQLLAATQAARTAAQAAQDAADDANALAQGVREDADDGVFDGADGKSAYQIAVEHGFAGTEAQWLESLHGQDATVDATLTQAGEAADAAAAGAGIRAAQHSADYAKLFAEALNNGDGIPLDASWALYGISDSRAYRVHTVEKLTAAAQTVLQISAGYRFYLRIYGDGSYNDTSWYGPAYASRQTYTVPVGTDYRVVIGAYPEDSSVVLTDEDVGTYAAQLSIVNNIGSGGGSITVDDALSGSSANPVQNKVIKAALDRKYEKPQGGIPGTDLAETYLTQHQSLAAYRTAAAQDVIDQQLAGAIPTKTSDLQNDSGFLTQHQSLAAYRTAAAQDAIDQQLAAAIPTKTSDLQNDSGFLTQHQDISGKADKVTEVTNTSTGDVTLQLDPGKIYHFTGAISSLTLTLATPASGQLAQYHFDFDSGSTAATISISGVSWPGGSFAPEASTHYEADILNGFGVYIGWEVTT